MRSAIAPAYADEVARLREVGHLSDADIAAATGAERSTVGAWLRRQRRPSGIRAQRVVELSSIVERLARILASRALHRLEYDELLEFTPDPFGHWVAGRHEQLARAELDRIGLQAVAAAR